MANEKAKKTLPVGCPACGGELRVRQLECPECATRIEGDYALPLFMQLSAEEQQFLMDFVLCSGSLKQLASQRGLSYPTLRNRLDEVIERIGELKLKIEN